ncbi:MAG: Uncharacterised protein [Prochlorococcus marinus str. MIT 9313]|nr:MAG: Uncharacterised protein [Prochlorococcus marinus str. MIT 9313]
MLIGFFEQGISPIRQPFKFLLDEIIEIEISSKAILSF